MPLRATPHRVARANGRHVRDLGKAPDPSSAMTNDTWSLSAVASLVEELDKKLLVVLRDGSKILGTLRSFDQFANIVLEGAVERIIVGSSYSDIPLGLYIVRGENVVLMGEVDEARETEGLTAVDNDEIKRAREAEKASEKLKGEMLSRMDFLDLD